MATPTRTPVKRAPKRKSATTATQPATVSPTSVYEGVVQALSFDPSAPAHRSMVAWALDAHAVRRAITS